MTGQALGFVRKTQLARLSIAVGFLLSLGSAGFAEHALLPELSGPSLSGPERTVAVTSGKAGTVLVFLSSTCPCSQSHIATLKKTANAHPEFQFFAINSNANEKLPAARSYFEAQQLPFPVIRDVGLKIADAYHASKTPHAFVLNTKNEVLYRGGVTNSSNAVQATALYLADALDDIAAGRPLRKAEARTLGCAISREE